MKLGTAMIAIIFFLAGPALAQTSTGGTQQKPAPHTSATPAPPPSQIKPLGGETKVDPEKERAIRHLMDTTSWGKLGESMTETLTGQVQNAVSQKLQGDKLQKFMDAFNQKLHTRAPDRDVDSAMVSSLSSHFSTEEIQGLIQFYESPLGKHMVESMPLVLQESQSAGATIERDTAIGILTDMSDDYPEIKPMLPPKPGDSPAPAAPAKAPAPTPAPAPHLTQPKQ